MMSAISKKTGGAVKKYASGVSKKIPVNFSPLEAFTTLTNQYFEYKRTVEVERTKRFEIEADLRIQLEEIKTKREIFMKYLDQSFEERKENFAHLFEALDKAIDKDDVQFMAHTLNSITELAKSSPFKDLADVSAVRQKLISGEKFEF